MMVEELEVVLLLLGIFVLIFIIANKRLKRDLPHYTLLVSAFLMYLLSWIFTNLENIMLYELLNLLEHTVQLIGTVLIAVWCWKIFGEKEGKDVPHSDD
ncbi:MAG: hypothetical protein ACOC1V_06750 [Candidatus Saliniplasma sp.]